MQDYLDKFFYRKRYDYRKTLTEFGRDLGIGVAFQLAQRHGAQLGVAQPVQ